MAMAAAVTAEVMVMVVVVTVEVVAVVAVSVCVCSSPGLESKTQCKCVMKPKGRDCMAMGVCLAHVHGTAHHAALSVPVSDHNVSVPAHCQDTAVH